MFRRFLSYYKPQMGLFVADTVCALVLAAIDLAFPIILRNLTGGLFAQGQAAIMQALGMIAVGLVLMYAIRCACRYFVSYWGHVMGARMESKMREDLFDQYERFSFAYFDRNSSGDMMSRVVNDLFDICEAAHHVPEWIIICGIEIIGSFVILFTIAPVLALAMAVVTAAFAVVMFWQNMRMREVFSDNRKKISGINAQLQDSLAGMRVVKSFANEETERSKFRASNDRYLSSKGEHVPRHGRLHSDVWPALGCAVRDRGAAGRLAGGARPTAAGRYGDLRALHFAVLHAARDACQFGRNVSEGNRRL